MTLIVAEAHPDIAFMVGDTLLSHVHFQLRQEIGPIRGEFHALKVQILNGSTVIAFAGHYDPAMERVRALDAALRANDTIDPTEWMSDQGPVNGCDFLLLSKRNQKKLYSFIEGQFRECQRAFIGDLSEYERYLEYKKPYSGPAARIVVEKDGSKSSVEVTSGEKEFDIVSDAMELTTWNNVAKKHATVGAISGAVIRVVDARISGDFEYLQSVETAHFPWEPLSGYTLLASNEDRRGVGIYFRSGNCGFILPVCAENACVPVSAFTLNSFIEMAKDGFAMKLEGGTWA
jgi:hypothetical protein